MAESRVVVATTEHGCALVEHAWVDAGGEPIYRVGRSRSTDVFYIVWDGVWWTSSLPECLAVELLLADDLDEEGYGTGEPYCFCRVGELPEDYDHHWSEDVPDEYMLYPEMIVSMWDGKPICPSFDLAEIDDMLHEAMCHLEAGDPQAARHMLSKYPYIEKLMEQRRNDDG